MICFGNGSVRYRTFAFFFHPLLWLARREEALCREAASDAATLRLTQISPARYGKLLVDLSSTGPQKTPALVLGVTGRSALLRRLHFLKDFSPMYSFKQRAVFAALFFGISALVFVPWSLISRPAKAQKAPTQTAPAAPTVTQKRVYTQALSHAKQLGVACLMKAADENDVFKITPSTFRKDVGPYLMNQNAFTSPLDKPGTPSFVFNKALTNVSQKQLKNAQNAVMVYEGAWGKPLFRYNGAAIIGFADGHVKALRPAQAKTLVWNPHVPLRVMQTPPEDTVMAMFKAQQARELQAIGALEAGNTKRATILGQQMLRSNTAPEGWDYGNIVHNANQILGLAALQEGRINDAKAFLLAAGETPGSPQLNYVGPNMVLAQKLLEKGEKQAVTQYLDLVARFWLHFPPDELAQFKKNNQVNEKQIAEWKVQIAAGETPKLNRSDQMP